MAGKSLALRYLGLANVGVGVLALVDPARCALASVFVSRAQLQLLGLLRFGYGCELLAVADSTEDEDAQARTLASLTVPFFGQALMFAVLQDLPLLKDKRSLALAWTVESLTHVALTGMFAQPSAPKKSRALSDENGEISLSQILIGLQSILGFGLGLSLIADPATVHEKLPKPSTVSDISGWRFVGALTSIYGFLGWSLVQAERSTQQRVVHYVARGLCCLQLGYFAAVEIERRPDVVEHVRKNIEELLSTVRSSVF